MYKAEELSSFINASSDMARPPLVITSAILAFGRDFHDALSNVCRNPQHERSEMVCEHDKESLSFLDLVSELEQ